MSLTIAGTYPFELEQVRAAYSELMSGHVRGKIVRSARVVMPLSLVARRAFGLTPGRDGLSPS